MKWFEEIQRQLPDEIIDTLTPAAFLESHRFRVTRARQQIVDRIELKTLEKSLQTNRQLIQAEKLKLDELAVGPDPTQCRIH